jgi:hypothetical protein
LVSSLATVRCSGFSSNTRSFGLSVALVPSEHLRRTMCGCDCMKRRILRTTSFSLFFLLSASLVHAQAPAATETPSRLSLFVHDFTTWLHHAGGTGTKRNRVVTHSPPLPRPRQAEQASAPVASKQLSELAPAPVPSKKTAPTSVQIRD